jgi:heme/copper-type cytochrome/quinol oxidase subunit 1
MKKLNAPKKATFWISVLFVIVGVIATLVVIPVLSPISFWLVVVGFVILMLGNLVKGL